jgi:hypothetical protein
MRLSTFCGLHRDTEQAVKEKNINIGIPWAFCLVSFLLQVIFVKILYLHKIVCQMCEKVEKGDP